MSVFEDFKNRQHAVWSAGDWPKFAAQIQDVSDRLARTIGAAPGVKLLDVGTGSGNLAVAAAELGADASGLDLVEDLIEAAKKRSADAGLDIDWAVGNAEELPYDDDTFDVTATVFGAIFAPRHELAASEMFRVTKPGGLVAVACWTPEGANGRMLKTVGAYLPPPPPEIKPPILWGDRDYVSALFPGAESIEFQDEAAVLNDESGQAWLEKAQVDLGPIVMAKRALEPEGKWEAASKDLLALYEEFNVAEDGGYSVRADYLVTLVRKP